MSDNSDNSSDKDLFRATVGKVRPLKNDRVAPEKPKLDATPRQFIADEKQVLVDMLSDEFYTSELQPGDILSFVRPGVQKTVFKKLRTGKFRMDAEFDLHGMRAKDARLYVQEFLAEAQHQDWRCIRIIHGKGMRSSNRGPVLKGLLNHWLLQRDEVLAFHSARPEDGGTGAVYVLLKARKNP